MAVIPITWQNLVNAVINVDGDLEKNAGLTTQCAENSSGPGDAGARSVQEIAGGDWIFECTLGPQAPGDSGRTYVGVNNGTHTLDYTLWQYAIHVSCVNNTIDPHPPNSVFVYDGPPPKKTYLNGVWTNSGQKLRLVCQNNVVKAYLDCLLLYTFPDPPVYPLFAEASIACMNKTVVDPQFIAGGGCQPVTWECMTFTSANGGDLSITGGLEQHKVCYAQSAQTITQDGEYFEWSMVAPGVEHYVGVSYEDCPSCDNAVAFPSTPYCHFGNHHAPFSFYYGLDETISPTDDNWYALEGSFDFADGVYTNATIFKLAREGGKVKYYVDGVLQYTSTANVTGPLRLTTIGGPDYNTDPLPFQIIESATFCQPFGGGSGSGCFLESSRGTDTGDSCSLPWTLPTVAAFPLPAQGGPQHAYFQEIEGDWGEFGQKFPDGKQQFNTIQTASVRIFKVRWDGLNASEAAVLDAHYQSTRGGLKFTLTDPRTSEVITGVRYRSYSRSPHRKVWSQAREAELIKYTS
jgi:hypothetical protein